MFGSNNQQPNDHIPEHSIQGALQGDDAAAAVPPAQDQAVPSPDTVTVAQPQPVAPTVVQPAGNAWGHPGVPLDGSHVQAPVAAENQAGQAQVAPTHVDGQVSEELIDIKQKALSQLTPLVGHLEQTPEEKFRTTMMMIQASDDQSLVPVAYEAANAIAHEKAKAQALLDIVNEINYFTSHHQS